MSQLFNLFWLEVAKHKWIFTFHFFFLPGCPWKRVSDLGNWDGDGHRYVLSFPTNQSHEDCSAAARSVSGPVPSCVCISVWTGTCPCQRTLLHGLMKGARSEERAWELYTSKIGSHQGFEINNRAGNDLPQLEFKIFPCGNLSCQRSTQCRGQCRGNK